MDGYIGVDEWSWMDKGMDKTWRVEGYQMYNDRYEGWIDTQINVWMVKFISHNC